MKLASLSTILAQKYKGKKRGRLSFKMILYLYMESDSHGGLLASTCKLCSDPIESGCQARAGGGGRGGGRGGSGQPGNN